MTVARRLRLFEAYGVELEYMIVDRESLDVRPITDEVLRAVAGEYVSDLELDGIGWSNELVLHVIELKTPRPAPALDGLAAKFQRHIRHIAGILAPMNALLMPTAMHPWMDPHREMRLWPHEHSPIYEAYHRIFCCEGHGWANLQSVHLNLPFDGDEEFGRLHAAIRVLLPLLPALAASSPIVEGRITGLLDTRMEVYRNNQARIPSLAGHIIPERVYTERDYDERIFQRLYRDIAPHDPGEILRDEFLNSRGAIARFGRGSIEIRVIDVQECPLADLAILSLAVAALRALAEEKWCDMDTLKAWPEETLKELFLDAVRDGDRARIASPEYLALFGMHAPSGAEAGDVWRHLDAELFPEKRDGDELAAARRRLLERGPLARRILDAVRARGAGGDAIRAVYRELCDCLAQGRLFGD